MQKNCLYNYGLFETMRVFNKKIVYLDAHLCRLKESAEFINLKFSLSSLRKIINKTIKSLKYKDNYLRLECANVKGRQILTITTKEYQPYPQRVYLGGFQADIATLHQDQDSVFAHLKTTNRSICESSFKQAKDKGFDEAILLNSLGYIGEATRSNIFMVKDSEFFTPSLECGCLKGITREVVLDLARKKRIKFYEAKLVLKDLYQADEAFLTNSLIGIMPLVAIRNKLIGDGRCARLTKIFQQKYSSLLK